MKQTSKLFLALMGATLLSANALAKEPDYDANGFAINTENPNQYQEPTVTDGVYQIANAGNLYWFAEYVNQGGDNVNANAILTDNIVVNTKVLVDGALNTNAETVANFRAWFPIGYYIEATNTDIYFDGTFDGQGYTISGLYFNNTNQSCVGLFGQTESSAVIKNVGVIDSYFKGDEYVAGICGYNNSGTIENCYNIGSVKGDYDVGGVCGFSEEGGTITNCYNLYGNAVGYNGGSVVKVENKKQAQFKSGEVAYLLSQGEGGSVWGQDLSKDNYPCHSDKVVYASTCCGIPYEFSNDENSVNVYTEHEFEDGICQRCHKGYKEPVYDAENGCYKISKVSDLYWLADYVKNSSDYNVNVNAVLVNDIVVNENLLSSLEFDEDGNVTNGADFTEWFPIGYGQESPYVYYAGTFDGKGYTISGLYFNDENQDFVGLFGCNQGTIQNVGVVDSYFKGRHYIGGVCGANESVITNCYNTANVSGYQFVGGVSGANYGGAITNCYNTGEVSGGENSWYIGGVCGYNEDATITNCYDFKLNGGTINGYSIVVDNNNITLPTDVTLVGKAFEGWYENDNYEGSAIVSEDAGFEVHTLYAKYPAPTQITADNYDDYNLTEDYIGYYAIGDAYELYWFANYVNKGGENAKINGVLVDNIVVNENVLVNRALNTNAETVANFREWFPIGYFYTGGKDYVYYKGTFDGNGKTVSGLYFNDPNTDLDGVGLFGNIESPAVIKNVGVIDSYFNGRDNIASVCGYNNEGTIENCYNIGSVKGDYDVGGVCGYSKEGGTITNCYNTGEVSSKGYIGGVCGSNDGGTIENCYDFKLNGGTLGEYSIVINEGSIALPADVTLAGKTFEGWYENDNYEGSAIVSEDAGFEVHTLYAKWVENSTPTAIKAVEAENNKTIKTIKDGQIVIIRNGVMYDMQGRKL